MKLKKQERREAIKKEIEKNPFITDLDLSTLFSVSIQTIRLDRTYLNIPELRKRIKTVARKNHDRIRSIDGSEIIGDVINVQPNREATSIIDIDEDSVFTRNQIARGHVLFAQANSLCVALIHKSSVLTKESNVEFLKTVKLNDTVRAEAHVIESTSKYFIIQVNSYVKDVLVFKGTFKMYYISEDEQDG
ncbi:transcription factor FapR [Staphylococcus gallinarum]|jgi:acyl-coenzyme A thioesterase PaaI-like protein|uniref:transcription factor FapR n=1 Tax=Staphylococcus gallinarum TaxID=1293 RepID=UPI000D1C3809|nr:transcription factor FapR [Staphylococcus gallinarum]MBU7216438.1 transcription factor FapR [Staphylococcus gallinarum]MCD8793158.1 transcription factor FapR [Staphylococcus gallinarum]MCD8828424.1 transcription factor FapR [Staphylococcus gallinarum]MCD8917106.1 transcription factor FapR [Staphylococcus gallinarum]MDN6412477.1 transcription factor FapR [Staphylococcus gallinarum]